MIIFAILNYILNYDIARYWTQGVLFIVTVVSLALCRKISDFQDTISLKKEVFLTGFVFSRAFFYLSQMAPMCTRYLP